MPDGGHLVLVVGPSGAGKDAVLEAARADLPPGPSIRFATRVITRPATAGGEDHEAVDPDTFQRLADGGAFALSWHAHGLDYGLPIAIEDWLADGAVVVANASRGVIDVARARYPALTVLQITAAPAVLARRLAARGREDGAAIDARLARADRTVPPAPDVVTIANDGALADAAARVRDVLVGLAGR